MRAAGRMQSVKDFIRLDTLGELVMTTVMEDSQEPLVFLKDASSLEKDYAC